MIYYWHEAGSPENHRGVFDRRGFCTVAYARATGVQKNLKLRQEPTLNSSTSRWLQHFAIRQFFTFPISRGVDNGVVTVEATCGVLFAFNSISHLVMFPSLIVFQNQFLLSQSSSKRQFGTIVLTLLLFFRFHRFWKL